MRMLLGTESQTPNGSTPFTMTSGCTSCTGTEPLTDAYRRELRGMNLTVRLDSLRGLEAGEPFTTWLLQAPQPNSATLDAAEAADWQMVNQVRRTPWVWAWAEL